MRKFAKYGAAALLVLSSAVGISYAQDTTPAATATAVVAPTAAQHTWLGVSVTDDGTGVTIARISANSPAETAQLQVGDVILSANGTTVETAADLRAIIDAAASGDVVTLAVERGTDQLSVDVTLATRTGGMMALPTDPLQAATMVLGAQLTAVDGGYQVASVTDRNPFQLAVGDVITQINGADIASVDWTTLFTPAAGNNAITLTVTRDGVATTLQGQFGRGGGPGGQPGGAPPNGQNGQPNGNQNNQLGGAPPANGQQPTNNGANNGQPPTGNNGAPPANGNAQQPAGNVGSI